MSSAPLILSLETATLGGSVFLTRGQAQLSRRKGDPRFSQSNSLLSDINESLSEAGVSLHEVDLFACASGPGSFTGLRIGIATLKGLAATLEKPCVGIPTLQAIAHAGGHSKATVALLPAGRGELFAQLFSVSEDGLVTELDNAGHLSPKSVVEKYAAFDSLILAGSGANQQLEFLRSFAQQQGIGFHEPVAEEGNRETSGWHIAIAEDYLAQHVGALALRLFYGGQLSRPDSLRAIYVRPSDAELKEQCR